MSVQKPITISPNSLLYTAERRLELVRRERTFETTEKMIDNENRLVSRVEEVFNVWDYVLFGIMLAASCIIGIFLAWKDSKEESKQTTKDYLLGNFYLNEISK